MKSKLKNHAREQVENVVNGRKFSLPTRAVLRYK